MKILHVYKDYPPVVGGVEGHLRRLAEGEVKRGLEVTVLVASPHRQGSEGFENGVRVIRAGRWATVSSTALSPALFGRMRRLPRHVTHLHFPYPWGELAHLSSGRSRATLLTYHSDIVRQRLLASLYRPLQRRLLERVDRIVVTSPRYLETSVPLRPVAQKCRVIPLGIDPSPFQRVDQPRVRRLRGEQGPPVVLFVGRLVYYKGLEYLFSAMEQVAATLLVIGTGPCEDDLRRLARGSKAASRIRFLGHIPDLELPLYYAAADLFVLPASQRSEAFGLVQLEAMAAGLAVVSTELGTGTSFVNRHQETGLVVSPRDPAALAAAINQLLGDPERRHAMGQLARQRVLAEFHTDLMVERTVDLYRELAPSV